MMIGFDLYLFYGMKHSKLNQGIFTQKSYKTVSYTGLGMTVALIAVAFLHKSLSETDDSAMFGFSMGFAVLHILLYLVTTRRGKQAA
jgi:APA family basic amino acid/polyamine antiporter